MIWDIYKNGDTAPRKSVETMEGATEKDALRVFSQMTGVGLLGNYRAKVAVSRTIFPFAWGAQESNAPH